MKKNYREKHYFEPSQEDENLCRCGLPMNIPSMHHKPSEEKIVKSEEDMKEWKEKLSNLLNKMSEHYLIAEKFEKQLQWFFQKEIQAARADERKYIGKIRREAYQRGYEEGKKEGQTK